MAREATWETGSANRTGRGRLNGRVPGTPGRRERRRHGPRGGTGKGSRSVHRRPLPVRVPLPASRPELPRDTAGLSPIDALFGRTLEPALAALLVELSPGARAAIEAQARLLLAWTPFINLTALRTPEAIALEHVADSLAAVGLARSLLGPNAAAATLLDLGSGAGYPGLPLAVALPARRAALVESIGKKVSFLEVAARAACGAMVSARETPPDVVVLGERAEILAGDRTHRDGWQLVVARAVAPLPELAELALPLVAVGGWLVAWKRDDGTGALGQELAAADDHIRALGGAPGRPRVEPVPLPGLADHRLLAIGKERPTPSRYPRPPEERRRDWPRRGATRGRGTLLP